MDPIAVFEAMADDGSTIACSPLIYGYVSYAVEGFRPRRIDFADIPAAGSAGPVGSALGGTGIAVSAFSADPEAAIDFAYFVASGDVQRGLYARSGGQPGHAEAWENDAVNAATSDFYRNTRATLEGAWLRPRHDGYMGFQQRASEAVNDWLQSSRPEDQLVAELNAMFRESFATKTR
jgi:multiple sugar transport system substrate-binding protein